MAEGFFLNKPLKTKFRKRINDMRIKQILFLVFGLLCYACGKHANNASAADFGQQIEETSLFLVADTIAQGTAEVANP